MRQMTRMTGVPVGLLVAATVLGGVVSRAHADGCMMAFREVGRQAPALSSPRQEAVLVVGEETVRVILRTHFRTDAKELAWIVPVPARPTNVEKVDADIFARLDADTAPRFMYWDPSAHRGFGCGCSSAARYESPSAPTPSVVVEKTGTAGIFKYVVLSATDAGALERWLREHSYAIGPGAKDVFARYVKAKWHWLAMRIRPGADEAATRAPHPVTYTYKSDKLTYPMVISRLSAAEENEIVLYVIAQARYLCANWTNETAQEVVRGHPGLRLQAGSPSGTNYEDLFLRAADGENGYLFVTEFAQTLDEGYHMLEPLRKTLDLPPRTGGKATYITRLRALISPRQMDRDVELVRAGSQDPVQRRHTVQVAEPVKASAAPVAALLASGGALMAGLHMSRGTGRRRVVGVTLLLVACAAFAAL